MTRLEGKFHIFLKWRTAEVTQLTKFGFSRSFYFDRNWLDLSEKKSSKNIGLMSSSSHIRRIELSVEPRNFRQTLDVYLLLYFFSWSSSFRVITKESIFLNKSHFNFFWLKISSGNLQLKKKKLINIQSSTKILRFDANFYTSNMRWTRH